MRPTHNFGSEATGNGITGKKTPGGAGTHTGHTGHTGTDGHTDHTDEPSPVSAPNGKKSECALC